jgi:hypothetical protein
MSLFVGFRDGLALFALLGWPALAIRTGRDARSRFGGRLIPAAMFVLGLVLPFAGPVLYVLARPARRRSAVRYRELRLRYLERVTGTSLDTAVAPAGSDGAAALAEPAARALLEQPAT